MSYLFDQLGPLSLKIQQYSLFSHFNKLTSGTTWHAAGLINTFGSLSATSTFMRKVS